MFSECIKGTVLQINCIIVISFLSPCFLTVLQKMNFKPLISLQCSYLMKLYRNQIHPLNINKSVDNISSLTDL